jgi:CRISPR-associated protein (TIGR02584 family)
MPAFRNILVTVVGLTPQVITETVYYLTQVRQPPVVLSAMHIITTQRGEEQVRTQLLAPSGGCKLANYLAEILADYVAELWG